MSGWRRPRFEPVLIFPAISVQIMLDRTTTIRASVADVQFTLALTIGLVGLVILLFLRDFWATMIPSVTVPLALAGSAAAMYLLNFSLDNLSLMVLTQSSVRKAGCRSGRSARRGSRTNGD